MKAQVFLAAVLGFAGVVCVPAQEKKTARESGTSQQAVGQEQGGGGSQPVAQTGLLPIYGVDFRFDPSWVDDSHFPSQSPDYPNFGMNADFQQVWDAVKASGFNAIRFWADVDNPQRSANRVANLCLWATKSGVKLIPVLILNDKGRTSGESYSRNSSEFVKQLVQLFRTGDAQQLDAYAQIILYQLEDKLNHAGLHPGLKPEAAGRLLLSSAKALRQAEQEALGGSGLSPTPLMVNTSFDYELIRAKAIAGTEWGQEAYGQAYKALQQSLSQLKGSAEIDVLCVEWYAGSLSAGSVDRFPALLRTLKTDFSGKQLLLATGFSTAFQSTDAQNQFYALSFANLADYRASDGVESPFLGVFFHEAVSTASIPEPPKPTLPDEVTHWNWPAKAEELSRMWSGRGSSPELAWWQSKVENSMGLVKFQPQGFGTTGVTPQLAQQTLAQISQSVTDANAVVAAGVGPAPGDVAANFPPGAWTSAGVGPAGSGFGNSFASRAQQLVTAVLDLVLQHLSKSSSVSGAALGNPPTPFVPDYPSPLPGAGAPIPQPSGAPLGNPPTPFVPDYPSPLQGAGAPIPQPITPQPTEVPNPSKEVGPPGSTPATAPTGVPSTSTGPVTPVDPFGISPGASVQVAPGLPEVSQLGFVGGNQDLNVGQPAALGLSLVNPSGSVIPNLKAKLLVDGKEVATKVLGTMLPKQTRSVAFPDVPFPEPGAHEMHVVLEGGGGPKPMRGSVVSRVQVKPQGAGARPTPGTSRDEVPTLNKPHSAVGQAATASKPQAGSLTRPVLPSSFRVGRMVIQTPAQRGPSSVGTISPATSASQPPRAVSPSTTAKPSISTGVVTGSTPKEVTKPTLLRNMEFPGSPAGPKSVPPAPAGTSGTGGRTRPVPGAATTAPQGSIQVQKPVTTPNTSTIPPVAPSLKPQSGPSKQGSSSGSGLSNIKIFPGGQASGNVSTPKSKVTTPTGKSGSGGATRPVAGGASTGGPGSVQTPKSITPGTVAPSGKAGPLKSLSVTAKPATTPSGRVSKPVPSAPTGQTVKQPPAKAVPAPSQNPKKGTGEEKKPPSKSGK